MKAVDRNYFLEHSSIKLSLVPPNEKPMMLSWRWGEEADRSGRLHEIIKLVFKDTSCSYLWVDFYCVDQSSTDKIEQVMQASALYSVNPVYLSWLHPDFCSADDASRLWISREFAKATSYGAVGSFDKDSLFACLPTRIDSKAFGSCMDLCMRGSIPHTLKVKALSFANSEGVCSRSSIIEAYESYLDRMKRNERISFTDLYKEAQRRISVACLNLGSHCFAARDAQFVAQDLTWPNDERLRQEMELIETSIDPLLGAGLLLMTRLTHQVVLVDVTLDGWMTLFHERLKRYYEPKQVKKIETSNYWEFTSPDTTTVRLWVNGQLTNASVKPVSFNKRQGAY